jgi:hypothetical protein
MTVCGMDHLQVFDKGRVSDFLEDYIVYRSLNPCDSSLPGFEECAKAAGWKETSVPRKQEPGYAQVVSFLLQAARQHTHPGVRIKRLVFLGDTLLSDASAFRNLCHIGGWQGIAFICSEDLQKPASLLLETHSTGGNLPRLYQSNRWGLMSEFYRRIYEMDFRIDEETVVIVDLDKTAIGGRGRNGAVIEQARQHAVLETAAGLLGVAYDQAAFSEAYNILNKPEFHPFTADNQDYLAYVCLVLASDRVSLQDVVARIRSGELSDFEQFITGIDSHRDELTESLRSLHQEFFALMRSGDPTPFKAFRRCEYRKTAERMGFLPDDAPLEKLLSEEIVITHEVWQAALEWKAAGALLFGLSDKPDEASIPGPDLAVQGFVPLHRMETHLVGVGAE